MAENVVDSFFGNLNKKTVTPTQNTGAGSVADSFFSSIKPVATSAPTISQPGSKNPTLSSFSRNQIYESLTKEKKPLSITPTLDAFGYKPSSKPKPATLPISGNLIYKKTPSLSLTLDTKEETSAKLSEKGQKYYEQESLNEARANIAQEIQAITREVRPGYEEPGIFGSVVEALKEGFVSMGSSLGATAEMIGNTTRHLPLSVAGQKISKEADKILASNPEWRADPNEPWGAKKISRLVAGAAPSLLAVIAATLATGGVGTVVMGFGLEGGSTYKEAVEKGQPEGKAQIYGYTVGTVNAILERIFPSKLLNKRKASQVVYKEISEGILKDLKSKAVKFGVKFTRNGVLEGSTEAIQELWSNVIATQYDQNRKLWNNLLEAFVGGFGAGSITGAILEPGEYTPQQVLDKTIDTPIQDTPEGKVLIQTALEAQQENKNIVIEEDTTIGKTDLTIEQLADQARGTKPGEAAKADTAKLKALHPELEFTGKQGKSVVLDDTKGSLYDIEITKGQGFRSDEVRYKRYTANIEGKQVLITWDANTKKYYPEINKNGIGEFKTLNEAKKAIQTNVAQPPISDVKAETNTIVHSGKSTLETIKLRGVIGSENGIFGKSVYFADADSQSIKEFGSQEKDTTYSIDKSKLKLITFENNEKLLKFVKDQGVEPELRNLTRALQKEGSYDGAVITNPDKNVGNTYVISNLDKLNRLLGVTKSKEAQQPSEVRMKPQPQVPSSKKISPSSKESIPDVSKATTEKEVREALSKVRKEIDSAIKEAEATAIVAQEQRAGLNTDNISKLKRIYSNTRAFQEGDIETIRASKHRDLVNTVIENVQEANPQMSEQEAFDHAINLPTKASETVNNSKIRELQKKEKKLRQYLEVLKTKRAALSQEQQKNFNKEWEEALIAQEKLAKIIEVPRTQIPIGEGKRKVSRLEARLKNALDNLSQEQIDELGLSTYNQMNRKETIAKATEYAINNPEEALKVLKGEVQPPKGLNTNSIYVAMVNNSIGNPDLQIKLATLSSTAMGQNINILKELTKDSPVTFMNDIVKVREKELAKRYKNKPLKQVKEKIIKNIKEKIKKPNKYDWNAFINSIETC